jgi:hypothetical protein
MTFANVVEGCLIYNFRIYRFCCTVQPFGETRSQNCVDWLENSTTALKSATGALGVLPAWLRRALHAIHRAASASVQDHAPLPRTASRLFPSRLSPGNVSPSRGSACGAVHVRSEMSSGPSPVLSARKSTPVTVPRH